MKVCTSLNDHNLRLVMELDTVYPKKYAHGFCFAVLCCGYTLTDFPISIRLTSLALWQSNDCPSASKATLMNMDKYFMWIHYERLRNHKKAKHNKTVCIFLGIYCICRSVDLYKHMTISFLPIRWPQASPVHQTRYWLYYYIDAGHSIWAYSLVNLYVEQLGGQKD